MKWLLRKITNGLESVSQFLIAFGPVGLFAIALLDSALVPLPGGPDAVMILVAAQSRSWAWMLVCALAATAGSVIGCVILYHISRRAGRRALERFPPSKQARVRELVERYDVLSVLVASVLPPPFPFKLFVITAGVFRLSIWRFAGAVAAGRLFRFLLEGYLAVSYGETAKELLAANYTWVGLTVAALIVVAFVLRGVARARKSAGRVPDIPAGEKASADVE